MRDGFRMSATLLEHHEKDAQPWHMKDLIFVLTPMDVTFHGQDAFSRARTTLWH